VAGAWFWYVFDPDEHDKDAMASILFQLLRWCAR
jgi:hypothetical protein